MKITKEELMRRYDADQLRLAFVGMSNIGKSFRSTQLSETRGLTRYSVDDEIAHTLGLHTEAEMATWLGQPYSDDFASKQEHYLSVEQELTQKCPMQGNTIIDTTGSVVYLSDAALTWLKQNFVVVHFCVQSEMLQEMTDTYFASPKPVVWGRSFQQQDGENDTAALRRCYPELLQYRIKKYTELADVEISGAISRDENINIDQFWKLLREAL